MSKADKKKTDKYGKAAPTTATPQLVSEVIPGKFTERDWLAVLQLDENEDFIGSIVQEIRQTVDDRIKAIEIERQLAPYTVGKVMNFVLDLFKLAYPEHQECPVPDSSWKPDFPPQCSAIDSWAEGSVPKQVVVVALTESRNSKAEEEDGSVFEPSYEPDTSKPRDVTTTIELVAPAAEDSSVFGSLVAKEQKLKPKEQKLIIASKPKPFKPNVSVLSVQRAIGMVEARTEPSEGMPTTTTEDKKTVVASSGTRSKIAGSSKAVKTALIAAVGKASLQREKGRPPMEKDVNYDAYGNIVSMIRISPESFPPLFVNTDYAVVDPRVEKANAELEAMRTGRYIQKKVHFRLPIRLKPLAVTPGLAAAQFAAEQNAIASGVALAEPPMKAPAAPKLTSDANTVANQGRPPIADNSKLVGGKIIQPRSIIEQIDLSPGVDIREGSQEKRGADLRLLSGSIFLPQDAPLLPMTQRPQVTAKLMDVGQFINKAPSIKPIA